MKLLPATILLVLFSLGLSAHPLHLSITNITYESGKLKISMKTFLDDWETAYFHFHSRPIDFSDAAKREIPWFRDYLFTHFRISPDEEAATFPLVMDTVLLDENTMTIEMHTGLPPNPNSLYIYNALLTDIYPDQTNLLIFGFNNRETGIEFDVKKHGAVVMLK